MSNEAPAGPASKVLSNADVAEKLLEVPSDPIRTAIDAELADGKVVLDRIEDQPCLFLKGLHAAERDIAERLKSLARGELPWPPIEIERAIPWVEQRAGNQRLIAKEKFIVAIQLYTDCDLG